MRKLITTDITTLASMPVKSGSLTHIQNAYTELLVAIGAGLIGHGYNLGQFAIIGCNNVATLPDYDIKAGFIQFNGVLYQVDAVAFTPGGGQTAVATFATTYFTATNADPVEFTDGNFHNVHEIKKIVFSSAVAGTGIFDYDDLNFVQIQEGTEVTYQANWDEGAGNKAKYRINRDGLVTVQGTANANGGGATINQDMFVLPTGFRPIETIVIPGTYYDGSTINPCWINVFSSGRVQSFNTVTGTYANDDVISFSFSFYNS